MALGRALILQRRQVEIIYAAPSHGFPEQSFLSWCQHCRDLPTICSHLWQVIRSKSKKIQGIWKAATSGVSVPAPVSAAGPNVWTNVHLRGRGQRLYLLFRLNAFVWCVIYPLCSFNIMISSRWRKALYERRTCVGSSRRSRHTELPIDVKCQTFLVRGRF